MKIKKIILLILTIMLSTIFMGKVNAAKIHQEAVEVDTSDGKRNVVKVYNNTLSNLGGENKIGLSRDMKLTIKEDNGNIIIAYCVDFGTSPGMDSWENDIEMDAAIVKTLDEFLQEKIINQEQREELINKLKFIYYFGYSTTDLSRNTPKYYLATQAIIWQTLSDYDFYSSYDVSKMDDLFPEEVRNTYTSNTKERFKLSNIRFQKYPFPPSDYNYNSRIIPYNASDIIDITNERNAINQSITDYSNKKPSFCGSDFGEMEKGATKKLTDTNNVLSHYRVTCDNATCTINGNKLTINASETVGNINVTLERKDSLSVPEKVYRVGSGNQAIAIIGGDLPTVSCSLTGKIVEEPQPMCYVCGNGTNQNYFWTANPSNDCVAKPEITEEASCVKPPMCYVCGTGDDASYEWVNTPSNSSCVEHPEITQANCIKPPSEPSNPNTSGMRIAYIVMICLFAITVGAIYLYSEKKLRDYSAK